MNKDDVLLTPEDEAWVRAIARRQIAEWGRDPIVAMVEAQAAVTDYLRQEKAKFDQVSRVELARRERLLEEQRVVYEADTQNILRRKAAATRRREESVNWLKRQEEPTYFGRIQGTTQFCNLANQYIDQDYVRWADLVPDEVALMQARWEFGHKLLRLKGTPAQRGERVGLVSRTTSGVGKYWTQARHFVTRHDGVAPVLRYLSLKLTVRVIKPQSIIVPTDRPAAPDLQLSWSGLLAAMAEKIEELSQ